MTKSLLAGSPRAGWAPRQQSDRGRLLATVRAFWVQGLREPSLYAAARRQLGLDTQADTVERPGELILRQPRQRPRWLAPTTAIGEVFAELGQTLLILGKPGAGKTTLLLELAGELLTQAEMDENHPMPVVFNLVSWAQWRHPFSRWLVDELTNDYEVPNKIAQDWVHGGQILPLLDGLDEMTAEFRASCIEAISTFRQHYAALPMAVCSQPDDYDALTTELRTPGAVVIQPLTRQQISHYLIRMGEPPAGVRTALHHDSVLWELLETPLLLSILTLAQTTDQSVLQLKGTLEERRARLFAQYIGTMLRRRGAVSPYPPRQVLTCLTRLACDMAQCGRDVARPESITAGLLEQDEVPDNLGLLQRLKLRWLKRRSSSFAHELHFLDYAVGCRLLCEAGGGYLFVHRLLQDYFATLTAVEIEKLSADAARIPVVPTKTRETPAARISLLEVEDLTVAFGNCTAVDRLSFALNQGETLGVVGESGCGKSLTALALLRLTPAAATVTGCIRFAGRDLLGLGQHELEALRGRRIGMIFQEPMTALNPVLTVGDQIAEMFILHQRASSREARHRAVAALRRVHIADAERRAANYPHQLSGGMRQRVMIAMALACEPALLIADEPTTAVDVTVQAQLLDLILELQAESAMAVLFISHNFGVISQVADRVLVMYAGQQVESAAAEVLLRNPRHPYTRALLATLPRLGSPQARLPAIPGSVPALDSKPLGCAFASRCPLADVRCRAEEPRLEDCGDGHRAACFKASA